MFSKRTPGASVAVIDELLAESRSGDRSTTSRLLSYASRGSLAEAARVSRGLAGRDLTQSMVVGITGPPGVGKSTLVSALITELRARDLRVGVLAIDPSSPVSGGAVLGDRIRMNGHAPDPDVFIRSVSSQGSLGGLMRSTALAIRVLAASRFDVVIVETVGVGQNEVDIARVADSVVLTLAPGAGDRIQAQKAGILEIADLFVVNKADMDGARGTISDLREMLLLTRRPPGDWEPKIVQTVATTGTGIGELADTLFLHRASLASSGLLAERRRARGGHEVRTIVDGILTEELAEATAHLVDDDPYAAAERILAELGRRLNEMSAEPAAACPVAAP